MAQETDDKQVKNLHTIEEVEAMGNSIVRGGRNNDDSMLTQRGNTFTQWTQQEPGYWYPYNAYTR